MKQLRFTLFAAVATLIVAGCDQSSSPKTTAESALPHSPAPQTIAHLHWLGKKQLAASTNATSFMRIWNEPESAALEKQTLDKLSTAPWRLLPHVATTNTAAAPLLRALLDDCVQQESYLEIRATTNRSGEIAFAIHLPADRAALWQTNLATVLESLTGLHTEARDNGWTLKKHVLPNLIELTHVGEWIVVGIGQDKNALFGDFTARILKNQTPLTAGSSLWVDAEVDLPRVAEALRMNWHLPQNFPKISIQTIGDGQNLQIAGTLNFSQPLALALDPWNLPTNVLRFPVASFTALRGVAPLLANWPAWTNLQSGPQPNQIFAWASRDVPMGTYFAAPVPDVTNWISKMSVSLNEKFGPWLESHNAIGSLKINEESHGLEWKTVPFATPFLEPQGGFAFVGLFPNAGMKLPLPIELLTALQPTNLIYYDWEVTGPRISTAMQVSQFTRFALHRMQLSHSPGMEWLLANSANFGPCITTVSQIAPQQFSFLRQSHGVGLTAVELQLLADWLEAPRFPGGLTSSEPAPQRRRPAAQPPSSLPASVPASGTSTNQ